MAHSCTIKPRRLLDLSSVLRLRTRKPGVKDVVVRERRYGSPGGNGASASTFTDTLLLFLQLRTRKPGVKDVVVEERRYDSLGDTGASAEATPSPPFDTSELPEAPSPVDPAVAAVEEALGFIAPPTGPAFGATFNASDPDDQ